VRKVVQVMVKLREITVNQHLPRQFLRFVYDEMQMAVLKEVMNLGVEKYYNWEGKVSRASVDLNGIQKSNRRRVEVELGTIDVLAIVPEGQQDR
jgi:hypothetical protein